MAKLTLKLLASGDADNKIELSAPFHVHVHNNVEQFSFSRTLKEGHVPIAYLENEAITPTKNLSLVERYYVAPGFVPERVEDPLRAGKTFTSVAYSSPYRRVLMTNQTAQNERGRLVPLYKKHLVPTGTTRVEIRKVSTENDPKLNAEFRFDADTLSVFNNFKNRFDTETEYTIYFVDCFGAYGKITQILNNVPAVSEATWEDIDLETGALREGLSVYTVEKNSDGYTFYLNVGDKYWVKANDEYMIRPVKPKTLSYKDSWYMQFSAGEVVDFHNGLTMRYSVPEISTQPYTPYAPYMFASQQTGLQLDESLLYLGRKRLAIKPEMGLHLVVKLLDGNGLLKRVLTTQSSKNGLPYSGAVKYEYGSIASWSNESGLVVLNEQIGTNTQVEASFYYEADLLNYTGINLNPFTDSRILNHTIVFYIVPNVVDGERAIHHLIVDSSGRIVYSSQGPGASSYPNLQRLNTDESFNDNTVVGMAYQDEEDDSFYGLYCFGQENNFGYVVLAEVSYQDTQHVSDVKSVDVLPKGGVPKDRVFTYTRNPKLIESAKSWSPRGRKVVRSGVLLIEAPLSLLQDYGGRLTLQEAETLLTQRVDMSVLPVIEWTYPKCIVNVDTTVESEVSFACSFEGLYTYNLYRKNEDGIFDLYDSVAVTERGDINFLVDELSSGAVETFRLCLSYGEIEYPASCEVTVEVK
jgi:hypothetical protein